MTLLRFSPVNFLQFFMAPFHIHAMYISSIHFISLFPYHSKKEDKILMCQIFKMISTRLFVTIFWADSRVAFNIYVHILWWYDEKPRCVHSNFIAFCVMRAWWEICVIWAKSQTGRSVICLLLLLLSISMMMLKSVAAGW